MEVAKKEVWHELRLSSDEADVLRFHVWSLARRSDQNMHCVPIFEANGLLRSSRGRRGRGGGHHKLNFKFDSAVSSPFVIESGVVLYRPLAAGLSADSRNCYGQDYVTRSN